MGLACGSFMHLACQYMASKFGPLASNCLVNSFIYNMHIFLIALIKSIYETAKTALKLNL